MKHIYDRDILPILDQYIDMLQQIEQLGGQDFIAGILCYIIAKAEISNKNVFQTLIDSHLYQETGEKVMTFAEQLHQEGRQEGHEEGRLEGLEEGVEKGRLIVAASMLEQGFSPDVIARATGLLIEKVRSLKKTTVEEIEPIF